MTNFNNLPYRKGVSAIIMKDSKFLVVQDKSYKNNEWKFPSGGIKKNETEEQALKRELKEELGTNKFEIIFKSKYKSVYNWPDEVIKRRYPRFKGQNQNIFFIKFLGEFSDIKIDRNEIKNYKWVKEDELKDYLIFPGQYKIFKKTIDDYYSFIKKRNNLPYRKNSEGYFLDGKGKVLARDSGKDYIIFPGGGVNDNENPEEALIRETFEETGYVVNIIKKLGILKIQWGKDWAKTEKQKERYRRYKGDEMHFFVGKIKRFDNVNHKEDSWKGQKLMSIDKVIKIIKNNKPFPRYMEKYYNLQLRFLRKFKNNLQSSR